MSGVTIWIGGPRGGRLQLALRLARRWPERPLRIVEPAAAAAGEGLAGATLALLDLRAGDGDDGQGGPGALAGALLGRIAERLLGAGCAALLVGEDHPGAVAETEAEAACAAALAALEEVAGAAGMDAGALAGGCPAAAANHSWLIAAARLGCATCLPDGRLLRANAELLEMLGAGGLEEVLGRTLEAFLARPASLVWEERDAAGVRLTEAEVDFLRADGSSLWVRLCRRPLPGPAAGGGFEIVATELSSERDVRDALAVSEQRYRRLVDAMAEGVLECGPDGQVRVWNAKAERMLGVPARGFVGRHWLAGGWEILREDGSPFPPQELPLARTLRTGEPHSDVVVGLRPPRATRSAGAEGAPGGPDAAGTRATAGAAGIRATPGTAGTRATPDAAGTKITSGAARTKATSGARPPAARAADGTLRWLSVSSRIIGRGPAGSLGAVASFSDITESRRAEEQLRLLQSAAEQTLDGIVVFEAGAPRRIVYANPAVELITGRCRAELLGSPSGLLIGPGTGRREVRRLRRCMAEGKPFRGELAFRSRGRSTGQLDLRLEPLRGPDDEITHWVGLGRDVTAQQAVLAERERLRLMISRSLLEWQQTFDAISMPVLLLDHEGRVSRLNDAARRLARRRFSECLGLRLGLLAGGEPWATAARLAAELMSGGGAAATLHEQPAQNGRTWQVRVQPQPGGGGVIVTMHDLTDLVQLQESLRQSATMSAMGMLVAGVAHEVRNPLFGLSALLEAHEAQPQPRQAFPVEPFRRGVSRLQHIMQQLLDYGQAAPLALSPQPILRTLQEAAEGCRGLARERQVEVALDAAADLPPVVMDESRILQVFLNLLDNAIRHAPAGSRVLLAAAAEGGWLVCRVEDAGPGVAAADQAKVFEPFFTRRRGGTGLGLAIVQRIVVEHGGAVACSSRAGGGTVMTVRLPRAAVRNPQPVLAF